MTASTCHCIRDSGLDWPAHNEGLLDPHRWTGVYSIVNTYPRYTDSHGLVSVLDLGNELLGQPGD